jgi:hypothetical protein
MAKQAMKSQYPTRDVPRDGCFIVCDQMNFIAVSIEPEEGIRAIASATLLA